MKSNTEAVKDQTSETQPQAPTPAPKAKRELIRPGWLHIHIPTMPVPSPHFSREMRATGKTAPENTSIRAWPGYMAATLRVGSTTRLGSAGSRFDGAVLR